MSLALTAEEAAEARSLIARLGALLKEREAAPAPPVAPTPGSADKTVLTAADFDGAARTIGCDVAAIRAVWEVESNGKPFGFDGRPTILFEPHVFSRETGRRFDASHGGVSYPKWGQKPYPRGTADERHTANWDKLVYAARLDRDAAYRSASYGAPQIMGFNFADAGFADVHAFVVAMSESAGAQLRAFLALVRTWKLDDEMREHRWADFARRYNGPAFATHGYDKKLAAAHQKWSRA